MLLALSLLACTAPCDLDSTLPGFVPQCEGAVLARYPDESRLVILGAQGGALIAYLPAPLEAVPYGGTTGRSVTVVVDTDKTDFVAGVPEATVKVQDLDNDSATVDITVELDDGWVDGLVDVIVERRD